MNKGLRKLAARRRRAQSKRRGVLLIIVLSLLVLFALIGLTFVMVAGQYSRAARAQQHVALTDFQGEELVEQSFYELLRGSDNLYSRINDVDDINNPTTILRSHNLLEDYFGTDGVVDGVVSIPEPLGQESNAPYRLLTVNGTFDTTYNAYAGCVLTMTDGLAAGYSTRIVLSVYDPGIIAPGATLLFIEPFHSPHLADILPGLLGNRFVVSGKPLNGVEGTDPDESYDAPDSNNPFLAFVAADAPATPIIPSFADRLLDYDGDSVTGSVDPGDVVVDNDGDGIADSGFIDLGFAIKTAADGRRYKPYAAFLCIDLDGRLNINAHGNLLQLAANNANYTATHAGPLAGDATPAGSRSMGFGPADINLSAVFAGNAAKHSALLSTRYGADAAPGNGSVDDLWRLASQGIPNDYNTSSQNYGSRPDVFGGALVGVDHGGRPSIFNAGIVGEVNNSPYQLNLVRRNGRDAPYSASELETLLRWHDVDRFSRARIWERHTDLAEADFSAVSIRRSITTSSFFAPVSVGPGSALQLLNQRMLDAGVPELGSSGPLGVNLERADQMRKILGYGIHKGGKMDVNQPWGNGVDNNSNGTIDEIAELATNETFASWSPSPYTAAPQGDYVNNSPDITDRSKGRYIYARQLYSLMMLVTDNAYKATSAEAAPALTDAQRRELTVRRIAQWAINCVDFRDTDAIMTPFEYDVNPFDGWQMDGDPSTIEDDGSGGAHPDRRIVWGMEYPDVLLTETLAFHDRRMRDTEWDNFSDAAGESPRAAPNAAIGSRRIHPEHATDAEKVGDKDLDQVRMPEGSLFLELYCTRNKTANNPVVPVELYTSGKLDLGKMAGAYPVWRLAISQSHNSNGKAPAPTRYANSPVRRRVTHPDSSAYQPDHPDGTVYPFEQMSLLDNTTTLPIERYVWFAASTPPAVSTGSEMNVENTFYSRSAATNAQLPPGQYLVVGPRDRTYVGSKPDGTTPDGPITINGDQYIDLATGFAYQDLSSTAWPPGAVSGSINTPVNTIVAAIDTTYTEAGAARGLNVSEPFPVSTAAGTPYPDTTAPRQAYGDGTATDLYPDEPLDKTGNRPLVELLATLDDTQQTQKVDNYRTVFLQRLANPLQRWNPPAGHTEHDNSLPINPYVTVDWQPIDLTVFNGEDREPTGWDEALQVGNPAAGIGPWDPDDPDAAWENSGTADPEFGTRQRRDQTNNQNLWDPSSESQTHIGTRDNAESEFFQFNLQHSLGYLNAGYGSPLGSPASAVGDPSNGPFPWLMWPNRPFISHYELMLVPASSQSRLTSEFTRAQTGTSPYLNTNESGLFGHLLNFYHSSGTAGESAHYYRILNYLETPSPFVGTRNWYDPNYANGFESFFGHQFHSPYHHMSRFRDPGRVNINTITDPAVWEAIDNNGTAGASFTPWTKIDTSRRGTLDAYGRFGGAFRGFNTTASTTAITASDIDKSLLRPDPATVGTTPMPLLGPPVASASYKDATSNAYFRMQGLQRLGNKISTQSNVYAIWVTVGYFEVNNAGVPIRELDSETGEIRRHRGFFIVDRTIPVGFQRGRNHNVDKCVLIHSYIE